MKEFNAGDRIWFMLDGGPAQKTIDTKQERLCRIDHKTVKTKYMCLSARTVLNPSEYWLEPWELFSTKEELLVDFVERNSK